MGCGAGFALDLGLAAPLSSPYSFPPRSLELLSEIISGPPQNITILTIFPWRPLEAPRGENKHIIPPPFPFAHYSTSAPL